MFYSHNKGVYSKTKDQKVTSLKDLWITEQYEKIKLVVGDDFSDKQINDLLESKWSKRKEPKHTFLYTKDTVSKSSVENMIDRFLNSNYTLSAYGVMHKQPEDHTSVFNDLVWGVIAERKSIRKYIAEQRKARGEEFMLTEFTRYDSKQKNRKIVVNAAYGVIASYISVFFNSGLLMGANQNSITKTGQSLTTIAISGIENWLENNIDFRNISDLLDYISFAKQFYLNNREVNEKHLSVLEDVSKTKFVNYMFNKVETKRKFDMNILNMVANKLTPMEIKSIYYRNNVPAISTQPFWKDNTVQLLKYNVEGEKDLYKELMKDFDEFVFHTTVIDFIHPERFTRMDRKMRDATPISDTDSVFISVYNYVQETKKLFSTDKLDNTDFEMAITKILIGLSDTFITYTLNSYLDYINVSDARKGDINMKSEYDYSRILVNGKKMYAGWKVGELSVPLHDEAEIDIKGLGIKKTTVVRSLRDSFSEILENNVLNIDEIDTLDILFKYEEIENDIRLNLKNGNTTHLQPASVSGEGSYANPASMPQWRGTQVWNLLNPSDTIDLPGKVLQIRLEPQDDYSFLEAKYPQVYERLMKMFETRVDLLGKNYAGTSKKKVSKKEVLDIICIPASMESIPEWIIPLIDVDLIVDRLMKPGQFILNAIGVSTPDDYTTNVVDRKIVSQVLI